MEHVLFPFHLSSQLLSTSCRTLNFRKPFLTIFWSVLWTFLPWNVSFFLYPFNAVPFKAVNQVWPPPPPTPSQSPISSSELILLSEFRLCLSSPPLFVIIKIFVIYFNALCFCVRVLCLSFLSNKMFFSSLEVGAVHISSHFSWHQADCYTPGQERPCEYMLKFTILSGGLGIELCTVWMLHKYYSNYLR